MEDVIVYQFGKVASSALVWALKPRFNACQVHGHQEARELLAKSPHKKLYVINIVRNLFDRNISAYFENLENQEHAVWHIGLGTRSDIASLPMEALHEDFRLKNLVMLGFLENWYSRFKVTVQADVFDRRFDRHAGFRVLDSARCRILLLRYEDSSRWEPIISRFLEWDSFKIIRANTSRKKWYGDLYQRFKETYSFSSDEAAIVFHSRSMQTFYAEQELQGFLNRYGVAGAPTRGAQTGGLMFSELLRNGSLFS